jgi:hypothetical protein
MPFDAIVESSAPVLEPISMESLGLESTPDIVSWPFPRIIPTAYHTFMFLEGLDNVLLLYEFTLSEFSTWEGTPVGVIGNIFDVSFIDIVDFGHYYLVAITSAGGTRNYAKLIDTPLVELIQPVFAVGCNNNGQFIGGNISNWQDLGSDGIIWSGIGVYEFNPQVDITSGFKTLVCGRVPGKKVSVKRILPYTNGVIVYTDLGQIFLTDAIVGSTFVYGLNEMEGVGVADGNHVAGNRYTQGFVNLNNEFCKFQHSKELKIIGYRRQIEELKEANAPLLLSFLEDRNTFFLSNGVQTLVINDFGAGIIHQAISGIVKGWNEIVYGTFRDFGDTEGRVTLDATSVDSRGKKTLEWVISDISYAPTTRVTSSAYWRNDPSEEYRMYSWKNGSPSGEFFLGLSAVEYRVAMRFSNYVESELFALKLNMKYPDARTRRGIAAISGVEKGENT